jgi:hypothetical protein
MTINFQVHPVIYNYDPFPAQPFPVSVNSVISKMSGKTALCGNDPVARDNRGIRIFVQGVAYGTARIGTPDTAGDCGICADPSGRDLRYRRINFFRKCHI